MFMRFINFDYSFKNNFLVVRINSYNLDELLFIKNLGAAARGPCMHVTEIALLQL